jgi:hypothetical protein
MNHSSEGEGWFNFLLKSFNHTLRQAQGENTKDSHKGHKGLKYSLLLCALCAFFVFFVVKEN